MALQLLFFRPLLISIPVTNFDVVLAAGTAHAADITAIEAANGTSCINGSLTAITGTYAEIAQALADLDTDPMTTPSLIRTISLN